MKAPGIVKETLEEKVIDELQIDKTALQKLTYNEDDTKPKLTAL